MTEDSDIIEDFDADEDARQVIWSGDPSNEKRDLHEADDLLAHGLGDDGAHVSQIERLRLTAARSVKPRSVRKIKGGVTIYDFRDTGLCPPNGHGSSPVLWVDHIPVIRNVEGIGDLITLGNVLKVQGLAVQRGTDAEGNVALYTKLRDLCYHARGVNSVSCGAEHMHFSITEDWTERQYRAAAWCRVNALREVGIPLRSARLVRGQGLAGVSRTGHTSHQKVSAAAGFFDRTDPGAGFRSHHVDELAEFYMKHGRF